jgi:hypothetical protein
MVSVGVGNKYLPEIVACHEIHNLFHALGIQFVEDIIQQE